MIKRIKLCWFVACLLALCILSAPIAQADNEWLAEFHRICNSSEAAFELPTEELEKLAADSDRLLEKISKLSSGQARVSSFRLKKCRNFYLYIIESRKSKLSSEE